MATWNRCSSAPARSSRTNAGKRLIDNAEIARISKRLVTLDQNVPLDVPVDELAVHEPDYKHLIAFLKAMEFNTITRRVAEKAEIDASQVEADAKLVIGRARESRAKCAGRDNRRSVRIRCRKPSPPPRAKQTAPSPRSRSPPRARKPRANRKSTAQSTNACARWRA